MDTFPVPTGMGTQALLSVNSDAWEEGTRLELLGLDCQ